LTDFNPYWFDLLESGLMSALPYLENSSYPNMRQTTENLIKHGVQSFDDILALVTDTSQPDAIRKEAITAVSWQKDEEHIPMLIQVLQDQSESSDLLHWILVISSKYRHHDFVQPLINIIQNSDDDLSRLTAIQSLGMLEVKEGTEFIFDNLVDTTDEQTRLTAIRSIMWMNPHVTDKMIDRFVEIAKDKNESNLMRAMATEALGELHRYEQVPFVIGQLSDPDPDVRYEACWSLHLLEAKEAIPAIEALLDDDRKPVGATIDHPTVAIIAQYAIDYLQGKGTD